MNKHFKAGFEKEAKKEQNEDVSAFVRRYIFDPKVQPADINRRYDENQKNDSPVLTDDSFTRFTRL